MSDFAELTVVSFFGALGFLGYFYIGRIANEMADAALTGFAQGHPVATHDRWLILYNRFAPTAASVAGFGGFLAFAVLLMGDHVKSDGTKTLAYLLAFFATLGFIMWVVQGVSVVVRCRSLLRQAEAN